MRRPAKPQKRVVTVFSSLKKTLKGLLGLKDHTVIVTIEPKEKSAGSSRRSEKSEKKSKAKERERAPRRDKAPAEGRPEREARPKQERPRKSERRERPQESVPAVPAPKPERPAALKEVPPAEGKTRFLDLPLHEDVQFGIQHAGFEYCTPIQALTLPALLEGRDLAGKAQTGTGKTAAFLLAVFTRLLNHPLEERKPGCPRALVLAPTRELAMQIQKDAEVLEIFTGLTSVVVFGGMDHEKQRRSL